MRLAGFYILIACLFIVSAGQVAAKSFTVEIVTDEARAVLAVLEKRKQGREIVEADWRSIFQSEGYRRLKKRELSMKRAFDDEDFKKFVRSDDLLNRFEILRQTLVVWEKAGVGNSARAALKYLPAGASIRARIYPVIKPRENSFVFEVKENPAIFLYLDPQVTKKQFENTLAHELHHIGFGTVCPPRETAADLQKLSGEQQAVLKWTGAFGEGLAMLAAAGGTGVHPHKYSKPEDLRRWEKDVKNFDRDLKRLEDFFLDVLSKRLPAEKIDETAFSFFGEQGPWYTVGWKMSVVIEKTYGRRKLIGVFCDPRELFAVYNRAARLYGKKTKENLAVWSENLIVALK